MKLERTNLLTPERIRASHRNYFMRLTIVTLLIITALTVIHGVFLFPAYLYLGQKAGAESAELTDLNTSLTNSGQQNVQSQLDALQKEATSLLTLAHVSSASASLKAALEVPRSGIRLTGFLYTAPKGQELGSIQVTGVAATRESLRTYAQALGALPFVKSTDLPISVYAQESDIPFTITLTGTATS